MNRSFLEKARIEVDLTALLDVIFIILMVVLCHQQVNANNEQQMLDNLKSQIEMAQDANAENLLYEERLDTYENLSEYINLITVYAEYDAQDVTQRYIRVMSGDDEIKKIVITPENEDEGYKQFEELLNSMLRENSSSDVSTNTNDEVNDEVNTDFERPVLCSLKLEKILYRDAVRINDIVASIEDGDLYFKEIAK